MWSWYSPRGSEAVTDWHIDSCHWEELVWDKRCFRQPPDSLSQLTQTLVVSLTPKSYVTCIDSDLGITIILNNLILFILDNTRVCLKLWNILQWQGDRKWVVHRCISARIPSKCVTDDMRFKTGGFNGLVNRSRGSDQVMVNFTCAFFSQLPSSPELPFLRWLQPNQVLNRVYCRISHAIGWWPDR